jgi:hypothetical protein
MTCATELELDFHATAMRERTLAVLAAVDGLRLTGEDAGELSIGSHRARVRFGALDAVHVTCDVPNSPAGEAALATNLDLPGSLRFAIARGRMQLRADTEWNNDAELAATLAQIRDGIGQAIGLAELPPQPLIETQAVEAAVHRLPWEDDAVVQLENGWELRPRIVGQPVAVRMSVEAARLRFQRVVLGRLAEGSPRDVLAAEALRINATIKHARLAATGTQVVAECCLHAGQLDGRWLQHAARAVAAASVRASLPLEILAAEDEVAAQYANVFLHPSERSQPWSL